MLSRVVLIRLGKLLPFLLCLIVLVSYVETMYAILTEDFVMYDGYYIPNKPISYFIGSIFEYDMLTVGVVYVISVAIETCIWNKLALVYLLFHLLFKWYVSDIEFETYEICGICLVNTLICLSLIFKGIKSLYVK